IVHFIILGILHLIGSICYRFVTIMNIFAKCMRGFCSSIKPSNSPGYGYWSSYQLEAKGCCHVYKTIQDKEIQVTEVSDRPILDSLLNDRIFVGRVTDWVRNIGVYDKLPFIK